MKLLLILVLAAVVAARPDDSYRSLPNFNVDEIVANTRLLNAYCDCFLGDANCTPEGKDIKATIPEAIQTNCKKCSDEQKTIASKFLKAVQEQLPEKWEKLNKAFNPDNKYDQNIKNFIAEFAS